MYAKIHNPRRAKKTVSAYDNKGSSGKLMNYLRTEELKENIDAEIVYHSNKGEKLSYEEATSYIDESAKGIAEDKPKFTALTFNFSEEEIKVIENPKSEKTRQETINGLTKKYMQNYAESFVSSKINESDLTYIAKVHEHRKNKDGSLNKDGQMHIHIVVTNQTIKGKQINPETGNKKHFSKNKFLNAVQETTAKELGTERNQIRTTTTEFRKEKVTTRAEVKSLFKDKDQLRNSTGQQTSKEHATESLNNNIKGLSEQANKVTVIEFKPKKGNYINNEEHALSTSKQIIENYSKALKNKVSKGDLLYYYKVNTTDDKGKIKDPPTMTIVISNRDKKMEKSVGANKKSFDIKAFDKANNQYYNKIVKDKQHISPLQKITSVINKKHNKRIDYKTEFENKWIGKETKQYKEAVKILKKYDNDKLVKNPLKQIQNVGSKASNVAYSVKGVLLKAIGNNVVSEDFDLKKSRKKRLEEEIKKKRNRGRGMDYY